METSSQMLSAFGGGERELRLQLQARCADLEYQLAVRTDELKDMTRDRDKLRKELEQSRQLGKARQEALDAMALGGGAGAGGRGDAMSSTADRTLRDIHRAGASLLQSNNNSKAGAEGADSAEEVYRLQTALVEATAERNKMEQALLTAQNALKSVQEAAISEVGKAKMDLEKEVITLRKQLEASLAKNQEMKRSVMAADQILASEFQLEGMSQYVSHSILVPSETVFQRLRAEHRHSHGSAYQNNTSILNNTAMGGGGGVNSTAASLNKTGGAANNSSSVGGVFQGKYDVSIEFSAATRSIILKGKRLCVELLKGEIYATLNSLTAAQVAAATGAPIASNGGFSRGAHQVLTTPSLGNRGAAGRSTTGGGAQTTDPAAEIEHLCRTISTHEATIAALHTAIQHAQDKAKQSDSKAEEAQLHISFVEEKAKQTQILCAAKEREFANESSSLRAQLKFAEEKVEKALQSLQDEAAVSSHYRDENDKLREELESVLASKEMSDRTGYVAAEQLKALTYRAEEATKAASLAIADKEHADRLQKEIVKLRSDAERKSDRLSQEIGQLQYQLAERDRIVAEVRGKFKDMEITIETSNTEIEVQRELINELRNRLLLALNGAGGALIGGGGGNGGNNTNSGRSASSMPILSNMSNAELLQKLSVPVVNDKADPTATASSRPMSPFRGGAGGSSSSAAGGLNNTPRAGGAGGGNNGTTTPHHTLGGLFGASMGSAALNATHGNASTTAANTTTTAATSRRDLIAPMPNDALTMQIIEDLYVENDTLKSEIAQANRDIREVAHALKETREVREQAIAEVERLQMEKSKWNEEKLVAHRIKMEEQLVVRQKAAEHEMALAALRDELNQYKARCEVLQRKLAANAANAVGLGPVPTFNNQNTNQNAAGWSSGAGLSIGGYGGYSSGGRTATPVNAASANNNYTMANGLPSSPPPRMVGGAGEGSTPPDHSPNTLAAVASSRLAALAAAQSTSRVEEGNGGSGNNAYRHPFGADNQYSAAATAAAGSSTLVGGTRAAASLIGGGGGYGNNNNSAPTNNALKNNANNTNNNNGANANTNTYYDSQSMSGAASSMASAAVTPSSSGTWLRGAAVDASGMQRGGGGGGSAAATRGNTNTTTATRGAPPPMRTSSFMSSLMASPPSGTGGTSRGGGGGGGGLPQQQETSQEQQPNSYTKAPTPTPSPTLSRYGIQPL